jgi:hypothetical protein
MKQLTVPLAKLFPALALILMLCLACTQQEPLTPAPTNATTIQYRNFLFHEACEPYEYKTCINASGDTRTFDTPKCASREEVMAAVDGQIPVGELFQTFRMLDGHVGLTYCRVQRQRAYPQQMVCEEKCTDYRFNYFNTGIGDWTLYLMSDTEWKPNSLVIYGLEQPYTYTIETFENLGDELPDGWWFEVRIHPDDWSTVLGGILFSAVR